MQTTQRDEVPQIVRYTRTTEITEWHASDLKISVLNVQRNKGIKAIRQKQNKREQKNKDKNKKQECGKKTT